MAIPVPTAGLTTGVLLAAASLLGELGPLVFVGLVPLLRVLARAPRSAVAAREGFAAGLAFFGIGFSWVLGSEVGPGLALSVAYALTIPLLAAGVSAFALLCAWAARISPGLLVTTAPALWIVSELARSHGGSLSIPWLHLGYALGDWPFLVQGASLVGVYGISAWIVAVNAHLAYRAGWNAHARTALLAAPLALGLPLLAGDATDAREDPAAAREDPAAAREDPAAVLRVAAVQPALDESQRHVAARLGANLGRLLELSARVAPQQPELIVWPESAWERAVGGAGDAFLATIAHGLGTPIVTGAWRPPGPGGSGWRNAAVLATADGRTPIVAEKVNPVPVYERAPSGPVARALHRAGLWSGRFESGDEAPPLQLARAGAPGATLGALVCIDASHPELARELRRAGARLLISIANEAGTGAWSAALHARIARLRAVENRVPVVRVANTGPTLWIDASGRVVARLPVGEPGAGSHGLALAGPAPPFTRLGDDRVIASLGLLALATLAARLAQSKKRKGVQR